jgi:hypothetical protein
VPSAPAASCAHDSGRCARVFTARSPESPGIPARNGFTVYFVISPAIGFLATVVSRISGFVRHGCAERASTRLDTSIEASGPHDFTVRDQRRRLRVLKIAHGEQSALRPHRTPDAARVHRIPSRVRDDRDTPLVWDETAADVEVIWVETERNYFWLWVSTDPTTPNLARRASLFHIAACPIFRTVAHSGLKSDTTSLLKRAQEQTLAQYSCATRRDLLGANTTARDRMCGSGTSGYV